MRRRLRTWLENRSVLAAAAAAVSGVWLVREFRRSRARRGRAAFHRGALEVALAPGATSAHSARLWGRSPSSGRHELRIEAAQGAPAHAVVPFDVPDDPSRDGTWTLTYPDDFPGAPALAPRTRYHFSVRHVDSQRELGQGQLETAPADAASSPERYAFAVMSCHLPFDPDGASSERACRLLELLPDALERHGVKRVLMLGDQMYGDYPPSCSLFDADYFRDVAPAGRRTLLDCTREEVRRLYQQRHRIFWKHPSFAALEGRFPCHMILDDHEIVDNFGTSDEHASPRYDNLRGGALDAFYDYQASRALPLQGGERPREFHQEIEYGSSAIFLMDLRSERRAGADQIEVCSEDQWRALGEFLERQRDKHVLLLGLSVPLLHVPDWLATIGTALDAGDGDIADRWTNPKMQASRDRLLHLVREHQKQNPGQKLVLLGGDVHVGAVSRFAWSDGTPDTYQLIASALSNREGFLLRELVSLTPSIRAVVGRDGDVEFLGELLRPPAAHSDADPGRNPYGELNVGIVEVERRSARESSVRLLLLGCSSGTDSRAEVVFDSGPL